MTWSIAADTPEQFRTEIVKWLNMNASNHSVAARIASRKGMQKSEALIAKTYEDAANFIRMIEIKNV